MNIYKLICYFLLLSSFCFSQGTWLWTGRVHSELEWTTIQTENFNVHYHNGIEEIAAKGAAIAEQAYPVLLKQAGLESTPRIDIIFTSEDEILNGYAMWTNQTFIWVDQNDAAIWLEDGKWLKQVLTHELQHIIFFNQVDSWMPQPFGFLFSGTPGWVVEGLAEYYTEKWRPYRSDLSHKYHVYRNKTSEMDPHHDGFSKIKLMSDMFGDSTIVKIFTERNKLGLFSFKKSFKKYTHMSISQFNEEWRQVMFTYYYGYKAQKESTQEIGDTATLPMSSLSGFQFSPDSLKIALTGVNDLNYLDQSLVIATQDTSKAKEKKKGLFASKDKNEDKENGENKKKEKAVYKNEEIDFGRFHSSFSWSPDGSKLVYAKYRFGTHGSMVFDLRMYYDGIKSWLTNDQRASYPIWSPDGNSIVYVTHKNNISNLFSMNLSDRQVTALTHFTEDIQIMSPAWSPDGNSLAFAKAAADGNTDIVVMDLKSGETKTVTSDPWVDYYPVWHPDNQHISFTSHRNGTPNLFTLDLNNNELIQNTDTDEAIWGIQWSPKGETILAKTMNTADSVRIVQIDPARKADTAPLSIRDKYTTWMNTFPEHMIAPFDANNNPEILKTEPYTFYKNWKHMSSFVIPLDVISAGTIWTDALGKHFVQIIGGSTWNLDYPFLVAQYINAQHGPLWGFNYFYNSNWSFRFYDESDSGLLEKFDGVNIWVSQPYNSGTNMSSNHMVTLGLSIQNREIVEMENDDGLPHEFTDLPVPQEGDEGIISVDYKWTNRRPDKRNIALPNQGWGINLNSQIAIDDMYGDFSYQKYKADAFINLDAGFGSVFLRALGENVQGSPPAQDYVGFSNDTPIYGPGSSGTFGLPENINPRGWDGVRIGDQMVFGTAEFRFPFLPSLPVSILGISIGEVTGALISDFGNVWGGQYSGPNDDWITTAGYEFKFGVQFGGSPVFFIGVGEAQLIEDWKDDKTPLSYVRFSLINPF